MERGAKAGRRTIGQGRLIADGAFPKGADQVADLCPGPFGLVKVVQRRVALRDACRFPRTE